MVKEMKYVQLGLLSDLPGMSMYRFLRKLSTGFEVHRSRRNASGLEGHPLVRLTGDEHVPLYPQAFDRL
jgi:hypothetical protein